MSVDFETQRIVRGKCPVYGSAFVPDPRDFEPDRGVCTPEELAEWEAATVAVLRGEHYPKPQAPEPGDLKAGDELPGYGIVLHVNMPRWGMGTNWCECGQDELHDGDGVGQ